MTRLLVVSIYYAPDETGIAPYATRVCEHLAERGYDVTALTGMPHYPSWRVRRGYRRRLDVREVRNGVHLVRRAHAVPRRMTTPARALYEASFFASGATAARLPRPDAVLAITPPLADAAIARVLAGRYGVPYGVVVQDLVGAGAAQAVRAGRVTSAVARAAEGWCLRGAACVGIIAEGFRSEIEAMGVGAARVRRLRNWWLDGAPQRPREEVRAELGWQPGATVCLHAGNMGAKQGLKSVLDTAALAMREEPSLVFALMGDGSEHAALRAYAAARGLHNVRFIPLQPASRVADVLAAADVLLVSQRASVREMALASKLTSYFAAGRPVVAAVRKDSETAREVMRSGGGIVVAPEWPEALLYALRRVAGEAQLASTLAARGRAWAATELAEGPALRGYEQFVASLLASSAGRVHLPPSDAVSAAVREGDRRWS